MKKLLLYMGALSLLLVATACQGAQAITEKTNVTGKTDLVAMDTLKPAGAAGKAGYQLEKPKQGEEIALMTTSLGEIKMRFFPEVAPKAVYSFKKHASEGYYDGLIFHRVMENFMIQGGDPDGIGTGGESVWGEAFEDEFSDKLFNLTGAVSMANSGKNTNGSQFFINFTPALDVTPYAAQYEISDEAVKLYNENGGSFHLDGIHTVFAQVFEGLDTVEAISKVKTDGAKKPNEAITIEKVEIIEYTP